MDTSKSKTPGRARRTLFKIVTGLFCLLFLGGVMYFLVFPLLPNFQNIKSYIERYSPYNLGYQVTVQFFVRVAPPVEFVAKPTNDENSGNSEAQELSKSIEAVSKGTQIAGLEKRKTTLRISSISVYGKIVDGLSQDSMLRGFWHYPSSQVPGSRGNVVIIGHRFDKLPPDTRTFYNLDKIKIGDKIKITQVDGSYDYTVVKVFEVAKTDRSVLNDTGDYRLTLITCTPLWTSHRRLIVIAIQDRVSNVI